MAQPAHRRTGLTLMEVLCALAIFLLALVGIGTLVTQSSDRAILIQQQIEATRLCQSKMAEIDAGAIPLQSVENQPFDEDDTWLWSLQCEQGSVTGLWQVNLRVSRQQRDGSYVESSLFRYLLDPTLRGSTFDAGVPLAEDSATGTTGTTGTTGSTTTPTTGTGTGTTATTTPGGP